MRAPLFGLLLLTVLLPAAAAEGTPDAVFEIAADGTATIRAPAGFARAAEAVPGERYAWNLTLAANYTVVDVVVRGAFDVERARQIVPEVDDRAIHPASPSLEPHFFVERPGADLWDVDGPARLVNFSGEGGEYRLRLGLPGPGPVTLFLRRDVESPGFTVGAPTDLTHYSFLVRTTTDEFAYGDLLVAPAAGGDEVRNPTTTPALEQAFPVQGLDADTPYLARLRFWDWAGNAAESAPFTVRTLPVPERPRPIVTPIEPAPNATLADPPAQVRVRVESPEAPVPADRVRLFVDKREVRDFAYADGVLVWTPAEPFGPGRHTVLVEATNEAEGEGAALWSFTVEARPSPAAGLLGAFLGALAAGLRRRAKDRLPTD